MAEYLRERKSNDITYILLLVFYLSFDTQRENREKTALSKNKKKNSELTFLLSLSRYFFPLILFSFYIDLFFGVGFFRYHHLSKDK